MASAIPTNQDTLVTLKINIEGSNRRFKIPLRDLGASTLPDKLRFLLAIPPTSEAVFERYSDSAAAFIVLDPANTSVYKQLYRAAKAKLKLRLKVTVMDKTPAVVPKPATVGDEETPLMSQSETETLLAPIPDAPTTDTPAPEIISEKKAAASVSEMQRDFEKLMIDNMRKSALPTWVASTSTLGSGHTSFINNNKERARMNDCSSTEIPVTRGSAARNKFFADLAGLSAECNGVYPSRQSCPAFPNPVFSVYCNNCQSAIPDAHYHCSTCDDGDFDLCQTCVGNGVVCNSDDHWMIKRFVTNGKVINSTTERIAPKPKAKEALPVVPTALQAQDSELLIATRTCNSCIQEFTEENFVTCTACPDFDLCIPCHLEMEHGHHPKHAFEPAVNDAKLGQLAKKLLPAGRNTAHNAICDGCDNYIYGVRHKCLDCPDWDYCSSCIPNANYIHPRHRFVPIYEAINDNVALSRAYQSKSRHHGIYCDGPLCSASKGVHTYIKGDRYKCAVCHDTDFCASCEASPSNVHNRTHPLIMFKTPVRNVNVTTLGDHENGQPMPIMGDRRGRTTSKATGTSQAQSTNAATQVQTIADLQPTESKVEVREVEPETEVEVKAEEAKELPAAVAKPDLVAHFVRDVVADGTVFAPNTVFEQTWYLRNGGQSNWPAGCSVKFVSGDNMCSSDPEHPASVHELISAAESTTCYSEVAPGQEVGFTVLLRTPKRAGTCISYWRLTGPDGDKFGHRLWCDVSVKEVEVKEEPKQVEAQPEMESSQMIFPKLEKESPAASMHRDAALAVSESAEVEEMDDDEFDDFGDEEVVDDETEDGFMTDEEYDILDASDEEAYSVEQGNNGRK